MKKEERMLKKKTKSRVFVDKSEEELEDIIDDIANDPVKLATDHISDKLKFANPVFDRRALDDDDPYLKHLVRKSKEVLTKAKRRQVEYAILRRRLLKRLHKIKSLKLTVREILEKKEEIFGDKPYSKKYGEQFLTAIKLGNYEEVKHLLVEAGKYLVYEFDHVRNLRSKRNNFLIVKSNRIALGL